ncbi:hypothetical protein ACA910_004620 [Epithemia clementina (nom. ined.)]
MMSSPSLSSYLTKEPLVNPAVKAGKAWEEVSWPVFALLLAFLPVWAVTILPLSLFYQLAKAWLVSRNWWPVVTTTATSTLILQDSGFVVDESTVIPREKRTYDIVVLGVTGLTGRLAARYLAKTYGVPNNNTKSKDTNNNNNKPTTVKWAVAGRSRDKVEQVLHGLAQELQMPELVTDVDVIVVDTSISETLPRLVQDTRVVATTAGPYALYHGHAVVEYCAKFGTHYVDITGEVTWVKTVMQLWRATAQRTGAKIVPFCGHDCIPWDLSVFLMRQYLQSECDGDSLAQATFWDISKGSGGAGTLNTLISVVQGQQPQEPTPDPFATMASNGNNQTNNHNNNNNSKDKPVFKRNLPGLVPAIEDPNWPFALQSPHQRTVPFVMADINAEVVKWSHMLYSSLNDVKNRRSRNRRNENGSHSNRPEVLTYRETLLVPDFKTGFVVHVGLIVLFSMFYNPITLFLFQQFVLPTINEQSPIHKMEHEHYLTVLGEGVGRNSPNNKVQTLLYMDQNAGILVTTHMMIEAGLCMALQSKDLPVADNEGGFFPPATALGHVLLERLTKYAGITFKARMVPQSTTTATLAQ